MREWREERGSGAGSERVLLQLQPKMAADPSGRHFLVSCLSVSPAQNGGPGRQLLPLPAARAPPPPSQGLEELGSPQPGEEGRLRGSVSC